MIDEDELRAIANHGTLHKMGMCTCPCYEALLTVGQKLQVENDLRVGMAKVSPEALAALTIGASEDETSDPPGAYGEPMQGDGRVD